MTLIITLKSGREIRTKCKEYELTTSTIDGSITGYNFKGITENSPVWIDTSRIESIVRVVSDEKGDDNNEQ